MTGTKTNIEAVFRGLSGGDHYLFGVTKKGRIVELLDPSDIVPADTSAGSAGTVQQVGDDLWFTVSYSHFSDFGKYEGGGTVFARLKNDGTIDTIGEVELVSYDFSLAGQWEGATVYQGTLHLPMDANDDYSTDLFRIEADGTVVNVSDFGRYGSSLGGDFARLGGDLYFVADQRSPLEYPELWRLNADGTLDYVYVPSAESRLSVEDVERVGDSIFFSEIGYGHDQSKLWRLNDDDSVTEVTFDAPGLGGSYTYIKSVGSRAFLISKTRNLFEVFEDGHAELVAELPISWGITEIIEFKGDIYISDARYLYRLTGTSAEKVTWEGMYGPEASVAGMRVVGNHLYFEATALVDDGFGGTKKWDSALHVMNAGGEVARLTGPGTDYEDIHAYSNNGYFIYDFATDIPLPIRGTFLADVLVGTAKGEDIVGLGGDDQIRARSGDDVVRGGDGNDTMFGGDGADLLIGGTGNDTLVGNKGTDTLKGNKGDDLLKGGGHADKILGQAGNDRISGGVGADVLIGGSGADTLKGDGGDDRLKGGNGSDSLNGGAKDDVLVGGAGNDVLTGGPGRDVFRFREGDGQDRILDFEVGEDRLDIGTSPGPVSIVQDGENVVLTFHGVEITIDNTTVSAIEDPGNFII